MISAWWLILFVPMAVTVGVVGCYYFIVGTQADVKQGGNHLLPLALAALRYIEAGGPVETTERDRQFCVALEQWYDALLPEQREAYRENRTKEVQR